MISYTSLYYIFSFGDGILIKNSDGIAILYLLFFACPLSISNNDGCKGMIKTGETYSKNFHTVNVVFPVSDSTEETFSHITSSINESLK